MVIFLQNIYPVYRPASHMDEKWKEITAAKQSYGQIIMLQEAMDIGQLCLSRYKSDDNYTKLIIIFIY